MGLSRRQFTKELKLAALQRLEMGASVAEVARAFEVNPNMLHRWRREFRQGPGNVFPALGKRRWVAELRLARHDGGAAAAGMGRQSQARVPPDARRYPAVPAEEEIRGHHRL